MHRAAIVSTLGLLTLVGSTLKAQGSVSVSGGTTLVFGAASAWSDRGYHAQLSKEFGHLGIATFRADALYSQSPGNGITRSPVTERTYAVMVSNVLRGPRLGPISPYFVGGIGMYGQNSWSNYTPGLNAGTGLELSIGRPKIFLESRIHQFWRDARESPRPGRGVTLVPLSVGVRF